MYALLNNITLPEINITTLQKKHLTKSNKINNVILFLEKIEASNSKQISLFEK